MNIQELKTRIDNLAYDLHNKLDKKDYSEIQFEIKRLWLVISTDILNLNEQEQMEFCDILDTWYLECKGQFQGTHPLGMRKEDLKGRVCEWIENKWRKRIE